MFIKYLQRHPDPEGSGGAGLSLAELEEDNEKNPPKPEEEKPEDPPKPEGEEEEEVKPPEPPKPPAPPKETVTEPAKPEEGAEGEEPEGTFWDDVEALTGEQLDVDYGDVAPDSPEGAKIYLEAFKDATLSGFENYLEQTYPEGYAFLEHLMSGGTKESFLQIAGDPMTLPTEAEMVNSEEMQERILTMDLKATGMSDTQIARHIKLSKTDDTLEEDAKEALVRQQKRESDAVEQVRVASQQATADRTKNIQQMAGYIDTTLGAGELDGLVIPDKDKAPFAKLLKDSIRYDNGKFIVTTELTNENIAKVFKEKFFSFKGGNLKELVEKQARTENTKRLQRTLGVKPKQGGSSTSGAVSTTLGDVE